MTTPTTGCMCRPALFALCVPLVLAACGGGSAPAVTPEPTIAPALPAAPESPATPAVPDMPTLEIPGAPAPDTLPSESGESEPATGVDNPFAVPEPGAALPTETPNASPSEPSEPEEPAAAPDGELSTHDPDGVPYCD